MYGFFKIKIVHIMPQKVQIVKKCNVKVSAQYNIFVFKKAINGLSETFLSITDKN